MPLFASEALFSGIDTALRRGLRDVGHGCMVVAVIMPGRLTTVLGFGKGTRSRLRKETDERVVYGVVCLGEASIRGGSGTTPVAQKDQITV